MILQALVEHYEDLAAQGKLARPGWSDANISYALYINNAGELEQVADIRQIPENGKGKPKPQKMMLPSPPTGRTSLAVKPAFLWDNSKYLLGIDSKGKLEQSTKSVFRPLGSVKSQGTSCVGGQVGGYFSGREPGVPI